MDEQQGVTEQQGATSAKVHFDIPDQLTPQFSDVSFVAHTEAEFRLSFYVTVFPVYGTGQRREVLSEGDQHTPVVHAKCTAQIILTPDHAGKLLESLQLNYASFTADKKRAIID